MKDVIRLAAGWHGLCLQGHIDKIDQPDPPSPLFLSPPLCAHQGSLPERSRSRMGRCCRGSSWRSSGWLWPPLHRTESRTCPALRSAPCGCSPGAASRRRGSRRRRRAESRPSRQAPTWKSNRSKWNWGLPTRKTAWREYRGQRWSFSSVGVCDSSVCATTKKEILFFYIYIGTFLKS